MSLPLLTWICCKSCFDVSDYVGYFVNKFHLFDLGVHEFICLFALDSKLPIEGSLVFIIRVVLGGFSLILFGL